MNKLNYQWFSLLLCMLVLQGCVGLNRNPDNFAEYALVTAKRGTDVTLAVNDLRRSGAIDRELHQAILDNVQKAKDGSVAAVEAYEKGDFEQAQSKVDITEGVLRSIEAIINRYVAEAE